MKLLLDGHIPAAVVDVLRRQMPGLDVQRLARWRGGELLDAEDYLILEACTVEKRIFVTYDLKTVPELLTRCAEEEWDHAGVFLADEGTVPPDDIGSLAAAISKLIAEVGETDTTNLVRFIRRP